MKRIALGVCALCVAALATAPALAQDKKPPAGPAAQPAAGQATGSGGATRGVITLAEVTITGRIQKPIAAVDVSRIQPKITLTELRQPFLDRIEAAIYKDPF
jgi:hypothetical protein